METYLFQNNPCVGSNEKNGTCYTLEECQDRNGDPSGTCANGYRICCICKYTSVSIEITCNEMQVYPFSVTIGCSGRVSENCSYISFPSTTAPPSSCQHTVCKCSTNVCRFRLDFIVTCILDVLYILVLLQRVFFYRLLK